MTQLEVAKTMGLRWCAMLAERGVVDSAAACPQGGERMHPNARPRKQIRDVYCCLDKTDLKLRAPFDARA